MTKRKKKDQDAAEGASGEGASGESASGESMSGESMSGESVSGESATGTLAEAEDRTLENPIPGEAGLEDFAFEAGPDTQVGPPPADDWQGDVAAVAGPEVADSAAAPMEAAGDAAAEPPPVAAPGRLANIIESLLFASDKPLALSDLKRLVGERDGAKITAALESLRARREENGIQVVPVAGGWQLRTNPENVPWVSRLLTGKPPRLSRAMLEALAIIAYRQPITRPEIDEIRGVDCGPVLKTLLERSLVRMIGKKEEVGRPILYGTTPEFLRMFSLRDLSELPTLREFHELGAAEMAKVDAASPPAADAAAAVEAVRPPAPAIREPDPEEEDRLLADLEEAAAAATKATATPEAAASVDPANSEGAAPSGTG